MNGVEVVRRLHQHRKWANEKLVAAAGAISEKNLRKSFPIGQGSIWKSLTHMLAAEFVWLECLLGDENPLMKGDVPGKLPGNQEGPGAIGSLDELATLWQQLETRWQSYLAGLAEADLDQLVPKVSSQGKLHSTRRGDILLHVCTHAQYTTAQVINMLRQAGAEQLPDPMLITLARQDAAGR